MPYVTSLGTAASKARVSEQDLAATMPDLGHILALQVGFAVHDVLGGRSMPFNP